MRLDEWQKYIGAQFLDEEEEAVPAPKLVAQTASPFPAFLPLEDTPEPALDSGVESNAAVLPNQPEPRLMETPLPGARPETTPNSIQNVVTMVVASNQPSDPIAPPSRAPRIELLTPVPEQKPVQEAKEAQPEVTNRTRRRSQSNTSPAPAAFADTPMQNNATSAPSAVDPVRERNLFQPLEDCSAEIPSFASYLPAAHSAAVPVEVVAEAPCPPERAPDPLPAIKAITTPLPDSDDPNEKPQQEVSAGRRLSRSRARNARNVRPENVPAGLSAAELWATVPRHVQTLLALERLEEEQEVAQFSYKRPFQEKRHELIERLLDPILSLEDAARLLNVCPTTVRRYTNKGILTYYRKEPDRTTRIGGESCSAGEKETRQRRFRLSDILTFLETQKTALAADQQAERRASQLDADFTESNGKDI